MQVFKYLRNLSAQFLFSYVLYNICSILTKKPLPKIKTCFNLNIPVNLMHKVGVFAQAFDEGVKTL